MSARFVYMMWAHLSASHKYPAHLLTQMTFRNVQRSVRILVPYSLYSALYHVHYIGNRERVYRERFRTQLMSNMRRTGTRGLVPVFWTGCSNNLWPRGALVGESRMNGSQRGFILRIHFSHDVIFCQVILKLLSKGGAKIINSAEYCIF